MFMACFFKHSVEFLNIIFGYLLLGLVFDLVAYFGAEEFL